jgi:hypothetical protein
MLRLSQVVTCANVVISMGDGTPVQEFILTGQSVNLTYNYTYTGTFTVSATVTLAGYPSIAFPVNNMTVNVAGPGDYK